MVTSPNPYQPSGICSGNKRWSKHVYSAIGFLIGFAPLAGLGCVHYYQFRLAAAALPPGTSVCGNTVIECASLVFVLAPGFGLVAACMGRVIHGFSR